MAADASSLEELDTSQIPSAQLGPDEPAHSRLAKTAFGSPPRTAASDRLPEPETRSSARASPFGRLARHLSTIMDVNRRLALGPDLHQILSRITEEAAGLLGTEASGLRLLEGDELARAATFGAADAMMARERLRLGESLSGRVALENRPIMSTNLGADARYDPLHQAQARRHEFRAWLGVPLRGREGVLGTLFVASKGTRSFDRADVRLLEAFANQAAIAIENARAFDHEQERLRQLEAIRIVTAEITRELDLTAVLKLIWQRAAELVRAEVGTVFLWDEGNQELVPHTWAGLGEWMGSIRIKFGEGTPGVAAERREGLIVNDYRESPYAHPLMLARTNITSSLAEPIVYQDRLVGMIVVAHEGDSKRFTEQDRDLLGLFATQAAIAIENARLHEVTRRRAQQLGALNDLSRRLTTVLDPAELGRQILVAAESLFPGSVGRFWEQMGDGTLRLVASIGSREVDDVGFARFTAGHGLVGLAASNRQVICCRDVTRDPLFVNKAWAVEEQIVSCVLVPLVYSQRLHGVLSIFTRTAHDFSDEEVGLLRSFGDQAAIAMENAQLFSQVASRAERMRHLAELSRLSSESLDIQQVQRFIVNATAELLSADMARLWLLDEASETLNLAAVNESAAAVSRDGSPDQLPLHSSLVGHVVTSRGPRYSANLLEEPLQLNKEWVRRHGLQSQLVVPLVTGTRAIGALVVVSRQPRQFDWDEIELLQTFATQAAIAIENARLFEQAATVEALRELARLKTEFLSTVSHELRTPLTLIYGYTELLVNRAPRLSSSQVSDMAAEIHTSTRVMARMVDDLLDFSRLEQGSLHLQPRHVVVSDLLYRLVDTFRRQPGGERIVTQLPERLMATLDPDRLSQVVTNLLSNALRYAPDGPIIVRAAQRKDRLRVEVADRGPGITPEEQSRIWESFYRGADMLTNPIRGSGLGLAVVKHLVELHGGSVGVNSTPGQGATFWLTLPIKERASAA